jgi:hypothetical protein
MKRKGKERYRTGKEVKTRKEAEDKEFPWLVIEKIIFLNLSEMLS